MRLLRSAALLLAATGCGAAGRTDSPGEPVVYPAPQITSLVPDTALAGASEATFAVNGSGFARASVVIVSGFGVPTTYHSGAQLMATLDSSRLSSTGTLTVRVSNPTPGGGLSATFSIAVRNPMPTILSLSPSSIDAGATTPTLQVNGTGFVRSSTVQLNGGPRATTFVNPRQLTVVLPGDDVKQSGSAAISVQNPTPGGGTSAPAQLAVNIAQPILSRLPSTGGAAGRSGFSLAVDGERFATSSVVTWNGGDRPTTYVTGGRLTAAIGAADVGTPGIAQVRVRTPGVAASASMNFTVRALGPAVVSNFIVVPVPTQDVVYDSRTDRLYATVSADGVAYANSVVAVDPHTGQVTGSVFVGIGPHRIVRSDDGQFLYVTLNGDSDVRRVQVSPLVAQLEFTPGLATWRIGDLQVVPGSNRALAIVRSASGYSRDVLIYDDDQPRSRTVRADYPTLDVLAFGADASTLYGYNSSTSAHDFHTLLVDVSGATSVKTTAGSLGYLGSSMVYAGGRVYGSRGPIVDPERQVSAGHIDQLWPGVMVVNPSLGRAYFINVGALAVYDLNNGELLATVPLPNSTLSSSYLERRPTQWGSDGLAFTDGLALYIVRASLIGP